MSHTIERLSLSLQEARASLRLLPMIPKIIPSARWSVSRLLDERVSKSPDAPAVLYGEERLSWRDLDARVDRCTHALRSTGIRAGDRVPLLMDNRPDYLVVMTALSRIGAVSALLNTNIAGSALRHAISVVEPKRMVVGSEHATRLADALAEGPEGAAIAAEDVYELADPEQPGEPRYQSLDTLLAAQPAGRPGALPIPRSDDHMCYIYTSGTTGLPKAAIITTQRFIQAGGLFAGVIVGARPSDVVYMTLPLYHSTGMFAGWSTVLQSGATLALRRKFSASKCWEDIERFQATVFIYIGELCRYLLNQPPSDAERRHRLRLAAGNGLRPDIWEPFQKRFGIPRISEFYGATEGNAVLVNVAGKPGKIGRLRAGMAVLRCDPETGEPIRGPGGFCETIEEGQTGLLVARISPVLKFDGYVDRAASEKKVLHDVFRSGDRWFDTGDLVSLGENAWLAFADRVGDTFRWKGENVSTNEVAEILNGAEGVLESNVYGVEVPGADGRAGMASLNVSEGFDVAAFGRYVIDRMPVFQRPHFLRLQTEMRITGTFKHQKVDYRREAYDLDAVRDPLFILEDGAYQPLTRERYEALRSGERPLR